ncbi:MAG: hypoxanthine phosphoribosyltransferase [Bacteroidales bacterium]
MQEVQIKDKVFQLYIPQERIERRIAFLAQKISRDMHGKDPLFLVVLNGAFMFASELFKNLSIPCQVCFARFSSYQGTESTKEVKELIGIPENLRGRHIVITEDIVDTGLTVEQIQKKLHLQQPASVRIATLLFKPEAFEKNYSTDYTGMEIVNDFVIGYGLDYNGYGRNLADIYKLKG